MKAYEISGSDERLIDMVDEACRGEEVVLTKGSSPVARIIPVVALHQGPPRAGSMRGMVWMADDFDAPLVDFREYQE